MQQHTTTQSSARLFDRALKVTVPGIATTEDKFILENSYYVNETETIFIQSTNETGKFFKKLPIQTTLPLET